MPLQTVPITLLKWHAMHGDDRWPYHQGQEQLLLRRRRRQTISACSCQPHSASAASQHSSSRAHAAPGFGWPQTAPGSQHLISMRNVVNLYDP